MYTGLRGAAQGELPASGTVLRILLYLIIILIFLSRPASIQLPGRRGSREKTAPNNRSRHCGINAHILSNLVEEKRGEESLKFLTFPR